jgi:hypothetical protein
LVTSSALIDVQAQIEQLPCADRAALRTWLLAHYEDDGSGHRPVHDG